MSEQDEKIVAGDVSEEYEQKESGEQKEERKAVNAGTSSAAAKTAEPENPWLYMAIAVVGIVMLFLLVFFIRDLKKVIAGENDPGLSGPVVLTDEHVSTGSGIDVIGLNKNKYSEINTLVETYFSAVLTKDMDVLNRIVEAEQPLTEKNLPDAAAHIEAYQNIACYTIDGPVPGAYVVYVYYEGKLTGIDAPAPSLVRVYVKKHSDGVFYIYQSGLSQEEQEFISRQDADEDVQILISKVNDKLSRAAKEDPALDSFLDNLSSKGENR
ncbi:MAG: hypothetical protein J5825_07620 [Lachnospiraceae bacterium]|nr:hypothetical protein [Lachnospiraceae bacterium]